ncbi:ackA [Acrasis kona]|uniref:AckA n=1 Tax=Acrasis kona TaxID=1008807 RepID=A0AAW2ZD40_9EUKA
MNNDEAHIPFFTKIENLIAHIRTGDVNPYFVIYECLGMEDDLLTNDDFNFVHSTHKKAVGHKPKRSNEENSSA